MSNQGEKKGVGALDFFCIGFGAIVGVGHPAVDGNGPADTDDSAEADAEKVNRADALLFGIITHNLPLFFLPPPVGAAFMWFSLVIYARNDVPEFIPPFVRLLCLSVFVENRGKREVCDWYNYRKHLWFCKIDKIYIAIENFLRAIPPCFGKLREKESRRRVWIDSGGRHRQQPREKRLLSGL